jgi:hypothetical protein
MAVQIIVKSKGSESTRRGREAAIAQKKAYYDREIRDGSRFRSKAGSKKSIRQVLDEVSEL